MHQLSQCNKKDKNDKPNKAALLERNVCGWEGGCTHRQRFRLETAYREDPCGGDLHEQVSAVHLHPKYSAPQAAWVQGSRLYHLCVFFKSQMHKRQLRQGLGERLRQL